MTASPIDFESFYRGKRVLVTGAGGFIGSHLVAALVASGANVRAMIRYSSRADRGNLEFSAPDTLKRIQVVRGDIRDPHFAIRAVDEIDVVFHLAALIGIPYSYEAPADYVATNVVGTLNMLQAAHRGGAIFVHTSTSETYGTAQYRPIDEKHPAVGQSPYSASKIAADKLVESFYLSFETKAVIVRPFNTFGPRQSARAIIPTIFAQLFSGADHLRLGSLDPLRDLTFVTDTAAGMMALGASEAARGKQVNLGTGVAVSIGELAERCMAIAGRKVPIVTDSNRVRPAKSEVMDLISNNSLAREVSGWTPAVTLDEGLRHVASFVREHQGLFRPEEYQV